MARPRIAVDCMGGDHGPAVTVNAVRALRHQAQFFLFGEPAALHATDRTVASWAEIVPAPALDGRRVSLRQVLKQGADSSMGQALCWHRSNRVDAVVSAGDTGALMSLSRHLLGMLPGVERPAIAREFLGQHGPFWMSDLGANVRCSPSQLLEFARQTVVAAHLLSHIPKPRVGLLNIGTEQAKGPDLLKTTAALLHQEYADSFVGFIEPNELFSNRAEVVVCEGFVGNIALKSIEGTASMARFLVHQQVLEAPWYQRLALALIRPVLEGVRASLDTDRYNGAQFLGLKGVVIKSHGSATQNAFEFALRRALECIEQGLLAKLERGEPGSLKGGES